MSLKAVWNKASQQNAMSPKEQCKLWALRQVLRKQKEDDKQYAWMASQVTLAGGGRPGREAVRQFFERVDKAASDWYPGYSSSSKRGRPLEMTPAKRRAIATSMMAANGPGLGWGRVEESSDSRKHARKQLSSNCRHRGFRSLLCNAHFAQWFLCTRGCTIADRRPRLLCLQPFVAFAGL
jgi:hypothetical protein